MAYRRNNYIPAERQREPHDSGSIGGMIAAFAALAFVAFIALTPKQPQHGGPVTYARDGRAMSIEGVPIRGWQSLQNYKPDAEDVACVRAFKAHGTPSEFVIAGRVHFAPPDAIEHVVVDCPHHRRRVKIMTAKAQRVPYAEAVALAAKLSADAHGLPVGTVEAAGNECARRARDRPGRDVVLSRAGVSVACALDAGVFSIEATAK